jgi:hypothetical protein
MNPSKLTRPLPLSRTIRLSTLAQRPSPFIRLPIELVHDVLQLAAASSRHCSLDICLVASWARHIALPYLFHTIMIEGSMTYLKFLKYITDPPYIPVNTNFLAASFVNQAWIQHTGPGQCDIIVTVFEACENITHLALQFADFYLLVRPSSPNIVFYDSIKRISPCAMARNHDLHLTVLDTPSYSGLTYHQFNATYKSPIFDRVTHLRFTSIDSYHDYLTPLFLVHFSHLSHLSVPYFLGGRHHTKHLQHFLDLKPLKMLVIAVAEDVIRKGHWKRLEKWVRKMRETDGRVYLVESGSKLRDEWEKEMRGGESVWDKAVRYTDEWESHTNTKTSG